MKKIINIVLTIALILNLSVICASAEDIVTFSMSATEMVDGMFDVAVDVSDGANLMSGTFLVTYDTSLVEVDEDLTYTDGDSVQTGMCNTDIPGEIYYSFVNTTKCISDETVFYVSFKALSDVNGKAVFNVTVDPEGTEGINYSPSGNPKKNKDTTLIKEGFNKTSSVTVQIGEDKPEVKEFAVKANLVDGKVVVTAENIGENAGTVYVATFNGGVLVDCETKALAEIADGWTVENLDGEAANAQIFVWNDAMVPLFDNVITVSAE